MKRPRSSAVSAMHLSQGVSGASLEPPHASVRARSPRTPREEPPERPDPANRQPLPGPGAAGTTQVPCSSGGSTSGNRAGSLGPGRCTKGTRGKHRREHVTTTPDTAAGQAQQDMGSLVLRPSRHHPHSPPPRALPTAGKHNQAPLELERAGWGRGGTSAHGRPLTAPRVHL